MKFQQVVGQMVSIVLILMAGVTFPRAEASVMHEPHQYLSDQGYLRLWGDTHCHARFKDKNQPKGDDGALHYRDLFEQGLKQQDYILYTGHLEQRTKKQHNQLRYEAAQLQRQGKLVGIDGEWTGSTETGKPNVGYAKSQGHVLIYDAEERIGQMSLRDGEPDLIAEFFSGLLNTLINLERGAIGVFGHPSLYRIEESFDLDGEAPGFDPPPSEAEVDTMTGCELVSHGLPGTGATVGLGDGESLRSSNEACYRRFLRGGYRLSPYMGTDNHLPIYPTGGPWTCMFVRERTVDGLYGAMVQRMTIGTQVANTSIALIAWEEDYNGNPLGEVSPMGSDLLVAGGTNIIKMAVSLRDKQNRPVRAARIGTVILYPEAAELPIGGSLHTYKYMPDMIEGSDHLDDCQASYLLERGAICVYAVATMKNGKQLISAPVFFRRSDESRE